jgi:hypothetical protein
MDTGRGKNGKKRLVRHETNQEAISMEWASNDGLNEDKGDRNTEMWLESRCILNIEHQDLAMS